MGRKSKITPEIQQALVQTITSGNWIEVACEYANIHPATFYRWMDRGQNEIDRLQNEDSEPNPEETPYREFCEAIKKAKASSEVQAVGLIRKAAIDGTWQAAAWYLERSHGKRWGRTDRLEHTGAEGTPIQLNVSVADLEADIAALLEGKRGTRPTESEAGSTDLDIDGNA